MSLQGEGSGDGSPSPLDVTRLASPRLESPRLESPRLESPRLGPALAALSAWIDDHPANATRASESRLWGRVAKIQEEAGEVASALIGATGQNPRKGVTHSLDDVAAELLDVAVTALTAYEHLTGNAGDSVAALSRHVEALVHRAGLDG